MRLTLRGRVIFMSNGAWGDGHNGVNVYMASYREKVADQITALVKKYDFDGVDIDWEYPSTADDWKRYDSFIQKLHRDLKAYKEDAVISAALSAGLSDCPRKPLTVSTGFSSWHMTETTRTDIRVLSNRPRRDCTALS